MCPSFVFKLMCASFVRTYALLVLLVYRCVLLCVQVNVLVVYIDKSGLCLYIFTFFLSIILCFFCTYWSVLHVYIDVCPTCLYWFVCCFWLYILKSAVCWVCLYWCVLFVYNDVYYLCFDVCFLFTLMWAAFVRTYLLLLFDLFCVLLFCTYWNVLHV